MIVTSIVDSTGLIGYFIEDSFVFRSNHLQDSTSKTFDCPLSFHGSSTNIGLSVAFDPSSTIFLLCQPLVVSFVP
jgi:hypothetical protein